MTSRHRPTRLLSRGLLLLLPRSLRDEYGADMVQLTLDRRTHSAEPVWRLWPALVCDTAVVIVRTRLEQLMIPFRALILGVALAIAIFAVAQRRPACRTRRGRDRRRRRAAPARTPRPAAATGSAAPRAVRLGALGDRRRAPFVGSLAAVVVAGDQELSAPAWMSVMGTLLVGLTALATGLVLAAQRGGPLTGTVDRMAAVPPALAPYVTSLEAYDSDLGAAGVHRGLPSTSLTFVLPMGEPLDVGWGDGRDRKKRWSTVSGLHAAPAAIHHDGTQRGIQLGLTTAGARALLGVPAGALSGEMLEVEDVAPDLADLPERLHGLGLEEGLAVVARALTAALASHGAAAPRAEVGRALAGLTRGETVAAVADEVGYSRRRLPRS